MIHKRVKNNFPNIKLFYEKNNHKKVTSDFYLAIPYGKKYFAWFTYDDKENVCIFIEIKVGRDGTFTIVSTDIKPVCFNNSLALNTLLYGTMISKTNYFCVENIFYYKNEKVSTKSNKERLQILEKIFSSEIRQETFLCNEIIFGLPLISNSYKWIMKESQSLPYNIYSIQCKNFNNNNIFKLLYKNLQNNNEVIKSNTTKFYIMATIGVDNYQLLDYKTDEFISMAYIPNFVTSKLMNSIFRVIKENDNLDALEESDAEDDFENTDESKYVDLNKKIIMECQLHPTFKKWIPIKLLSS